ncbi:hypothetical protein MMC11_001517 [Xylographa trunciseda]|nr:hypothetical protein [Xylographa trunciseda]
MPNRYSHALVLATYENRGLIDTANCSRPNHPSYKYTASEPATRRQSLGPLQSPAKPQKVGASSLDNVPRSSRAARILAAPPRNPSPAPPSRSPNPAPTPIGNERPAGAHVRQNSDNGTVVSFQSASSTSAPAPSVITQIYSPERQLRSPRIPRVVIHDEDAPLPPPSPPLKIVTPSLPAPKIQQPAQRPALVSTRSPRLYISDKMSSASSFVSADEPTLDFSCLDDPPIPQQTKSQTAQRKASHRLSLPVTSRTTSTISSISSHRNSCTLPDISRSRPATARPRSLTSTSTQSLAASDDDDSELYFGSADESSEDNSPSPVSVPTSTESMKRLDSMKHLELMKQLEAMKKPGLEDGRKAGKGTGLTTNRGQMSLTYAPPITLPNTTNLNPTDFATDPDQNSVRGYSPDDAAPPPIARVRRVNFQSPPETAAPTPRPRSSSITQRLSSLKSNFLNKAPFSGTPRSSFSQRPASSSSRPASSGGSMVSGSMVSGPRGRLILMDKPSKKLEKKAGKELLACSVPYERAKQAKSPIMTSDRNDLMPVGRGWTIGDRGFEESRRASRDEERVRRR